MDTRHDLLHSRIFDGLTDEERRWCLSGAQVVTMRKGHWVARQGDPATTFYLIETGALKVVQGTAEGQELIVRFAGPGDPFGAVAVVEHSRYPVSARAVEVTRLHGWSGTAMSAMLDRYPRVNVNVMREMTAHMTDALTRVREMTTQRVGQRLAMTLVRLSRQCGRRTDDGILITHPLTRQELADLTGTTLYTVSRTLSQWDVDGILTSRQRHLVITSPHRLAQLAEGP